MESFAAAIRLAASAGFVKPTSVIGSADGEIDDVTATARRSSCVRKGAPAGAVNGGTRDGKLPRSCRQLLSNHSKTAKRLRPKTPDSSGSVARSLQARTPVKGLRS